MDVINFISKVQTFPDAPVTNPDEEYQPAPMFYANGFVCTISKGFVVLLL